MIIMLYLIAGALIGWLASLVLGTDTQGRKPISMLLYVSVGMMSLVLAGFLLTPVIELREETASMLSLPALVAALLGAVVLLGLLGLMHLWRRRTVR